ncbi:MAG: LbtU family siderophore porin [Lentisphaerae bacterium]|nr:LbtU family siderophore porin [Lentisphaerota bacterium]
MKTKRKNGWRTVATAAVCALAAAGAEEVTAEWEGMEWAPGVGIGVLVEVEASLEEQDGEEASDVNVATFEVGLEAEPMEGVRGEAALLWEEGEEVDIDVAIMELGGTDAVPLVLSAGRMYLPFGAYNSLMVSDPLTLELGETRETAVALSGEWRGFAAWAGAFAGELEDAEDVAKGAAALAWSPAAGVTLGVSALSDLGEGGGYVDDLNAVLAEGGTYADAAGVSAFVRLELDSLTVAAEYLGAVNDLAWSDAGGETTTKGRPQAWHVDAAWAFANDWTAAVRYEGSKEFKTDEMPEHQGGAALFWQVHELATIGVEYLYGTFDEEETDDRQVATVHLALEF